MISKFVVHTQFGEMRPYITFLIILSEFQSLTLSANKPLNICRVDFNRDFRTVIHKLHNTAQR